MTIIYPEDPEPGGRRIKITLTEFLLARIAEDMDYRVKRLRDGYLPTPRELSEAGRWEADCEARRQIVELHSATRWTAEGMEYDLCDTCRDQVSPCPTLRALALTYASHEDYDESWRP